MRSAQKSCRAALAAALAFTVVLDARAAEVTFINNNDPRWSVATNWSTGMLPRPGDDVLIDGLGPNAFTFVNLDTHANVATLRVLSNKRLYLKDGFALTLTGAAINSAGTIEFQSAGGPTSILVGGSGELLASGGGRIVMHGAGARIAGDGIGAGGGRFVNVDQEIRGEGAIGAGAIGIENRAAGVIDARPGAAFGIDLDPSPASGMVNRGVAQASSGGVLRLLGSGGGSFDNTGGTFRALEGSQVYLSSGAVVTGGNVASVGTGVVRLPEQQTATLRDVALSGQLALNSSATLTLAGTVVNTGSITLQRDLSGSRPTTLLVPNGDTATLAGGGSVIIENGHIRGRLINLDNTIEGSASIGVFSEGIDNRGVIRSVQPNTGMTIFSHATVPMRNAGTIAVSNGGAITLAGQLGRVFLNDGGHIEASPTGGDWILLDSGATVVGGTMGPGFLGVQPLTSGRVENIDLRGVFLISGGLTLAGTITNSGQFLTEGRLNIDGVVTLLGPGHVTAEGSGRVGGSGTLVNESNQIIGVGNLGDNAIAIDNRAGGLIASRTGFQSSTFVLDPAPAGGFVNAGTLRAGGGTLVLSGNGGGSFDSAAGSIQVLAGATLSTTAGAVLRAGPVSNHGTFAHQTTADVGAVDGTGTVMVGAGAALSAARVRQARLALAEGASVTLRADGTDAATSRLNALDLHGAAGAWLATLDLNDNALVIDYAGGSPLPTVRSQVRIAYAGGAWTGSGITSTAARATAGSEHTTAIGYAEAADLFAQFPALFRGQVIDATALLLAHVPSGDATLDGAVNLADFNRLAANFGAAPDARWTQADFNYDGMVNLEDFNLLAANFGFSAGSDGVLGAGDWAGLAAAVPEPAISAVTGALALTCAARVSRRARSSSTR
jgi:hypothetical protein